MMKNCNSAAILTHINEDPDTIGSCLAFREALLNMGKRAVVYVSAAVEKRISFIGTDYVIYDGKEQEKHDLCVCIDCGDILRIGKRKELFDKAEHSINIDHHRTNTLFAEVNYVDALSSAAGEILCGLFDEMNIEKNDKIARLLYTAIASDTGSFKYSNVTPKTMRAAADLMEYSFDHSEILRLLFDCKSLKNAKIEAQALNEMESFCGGKIRLVTMTKEMYEKYDVEVQDAPNLVDVPREIEGTEIALCLKEQESEIRVNMRSNGYADVSKAAVALGGGGHIRAAGASVKGKTLEEAKKIVVAECEKVL